VAEQTWPPVAPPPGALALYRGIAAEPAPNGWRLAAPLPDQVAVADRLRAGRPLVQLVPPVVRPASFLAVVRRLARLAAAHLPGGDGGKALGGTLALFQAARPDSLALGRLVVKGGWEAEPTAAFLLEQASRAYLRAYAAEAEARFPLLRQLREGAGVWSLPVCPICGAGPGLGRLEEGSRGGAGRRLLLCQRCGAGWGFARFACPFCRDAGPVGVVTVGGDAIAELHTCKACRGYLKVLRPGAPGNPVTWDVETLYLDLVAEGMGFRPGGSPAGPGRQPSETPAPPG